MGCNQLRHKPEWDKSNLFAILILSSDACPEPIDENEADHLQLQYHPVSICCLPRCKSSEHIADPEMAPESIPDHCVLLGRAEKGAHQIARRKTPVLVYSLDVRLRLQTGVRRTPTNKTISIQSRQAGAKHKDSVRRSVGPVSQGGLSEKKLHILSCNWGCVQKLGVFRP